MRFFLVIALFFLFSQISSAQSRDMYGTILKEIERAGSFNLIALEVDSTSYKGRAVIENGDLYFFLNETKGLDKAAYETFMTDLLINKKKLSVLDVEFKKYNFVRVTEIKEVNEFAAKGKKEFLNHYFCGKYLKAEIVENAKSFDPMYAVADKLFQWQIPTYVDDISGILAIWDYENMK